MSEGQRETEIEVSFTTTLGESYDDSSEQEINGFVEEHIKDYCQEHKIDRTSVTVITDELRHKVKQYRKSLIY